MRQQCGQTYGKEEQILGGRVTRPHRLLLLSGCHLVCPARAENQAVEETAAEATAEVARRRLRSLELTRRCPT